MGRSSIARPAEHKAFVNLYKLAKKRGAPTVYLDRLNNYIIQSKIPYDHANKNKKWNGTLDDRYENSLRAKIKDFAITTDALLWNYKVHVSESKDEQVRHATDVIINQLRYQTKTSHSQEIDGEVTFYVHSSWSNRGPQWVLAFIDGGPEYFKIEPYELLKLTMRKNTCVETNNRNGYWVFYQALAEAGGTIHSLSREATKAISHIIEEDHDNNY